MVTVVIVSGRGVGPGGGQEEGFSPSSSFAV